MLNIAQSRLVHASQSRAFQGRSPDWSYRLSTCFNYSRSNDLSGRKFKNVFRRIFISAMGLSAFRACPVTDIQRELSHGKPAAGTALGARKETIRNAEFLPIPSAFIFEHGPEHSEAGAADVLGKRRVFHHPSHVQIFDCDHIELAHEPGGQFVQRVLAGVRDLRVTAGNCQLRLLAAVAAFSLLRKAPLEESQTFLPLPGVARVRDTLPVAECGKAGKPEVDTDFLPGLREVVDLLLESEGDEVFVVRRLGECDGAWVGLELAGPVDAEATELGDGKIFIRGIPLETAGCVFSSLLTLPVFELRELRTFSEEIRVGGLQVPEGLLERYRGDFLQVGELRQLLLGCQSRAASVIVGGNSRLETIHAESKSRVVSNPDTTESLSKNPLLRFAWIESECLLYFQLTKITTYL